MRIGVRFVPENWGKGKDGRKPNTVRALDGKDTIEVENTKTGEVFKGVITDITNWKGTIVISWHPAQAAGA